MKELKDTITIFQNFACTKKERLDFVTDNVPKLAKVLGDYNHHINYNHTQYFEQYNKLYKDNYTNLVMYNDLTKDFITTPNDTLCVLNQQIMNIIQTTKLLFVINDTSLISLAISNAIVNDYTNKLGTGNAYFNFSHVDIITDIVDEVITNYGNTISVSTELRQNTIGFLTMSNKVLDDRRTGE